MMASKQRVEEVVQNEVGTVRDMAENGRERYGWRLIDGEQRFVVIAISFTLVARADEGLAAFKARMLALAAQLGALQYPVVNMTVHRQVAQRKPPWCVFECDTPETAAQDDDG